MQRKNKLGLSGMETFKEEMKEQASLEYTQAQWSNTWVFKIWIFCQNLEAYLGDIISFRIELLTMYWGPWAFCHDSIPNSTEAMLACQPALFTEWLDWVENFWWLRTVIYADSSHCLQGSKVKQKRWPNKDETPSQLWYYLYCLRYVLLAWRRCSEGVMADTPPSFSGEDWHTLLYNNSSAKHLRIPRHHHWSMGCGSVGDNLQKKKKKKKGTPCFLNPHHSHSKLICWVSGGGARHSVWANVSALRPHVSASALGEAERTQTESIPCLTLQRKTFGQQPWFQLGIWYEYTKCWYDYQTDVHRWSWKFKT